MQKTVNYYSSHLSLMAVSHASCGVFVRELNAIWIFKEKRQMEGQTFSHFKHAIYSLNPIPYYFSCYLQSTL